MPQGNVKLYFYVVVGGENKPGETNVPTHKAQSFCCIYKWKYILSSNKTPIHLLSPIPPRAVVR